MIIKINHTPNNKNIRTCNSQNNNDTQTNCITKFNANTETYFV